MTLQEFKLINQVSFSLLAYFIESKWLF